MLFKITLVSFLLFFRFGGLLSQGYDFYYDALVKTHQISMEKDSIIHVYYESFMIKRSFKYNGYFIVIVKETDVSDYFSDNDTNVVYRLYPLELEKGKFYLNIRPFYVASNRVEDLKNHKISITTLAMGGSTYKFRLIKKRTKKKFKTVFIEKIGH
jgi:hypothetical protein